MRKILKKNFFDRDTKIVAKDLLGKFIVRKIRGKEISAMITETESYDGPHDLASHASKGKTKRTAVMFGHPGYFYIYLCYGIHYMLNVVTRERDYPAAVLIRGLDKAIGPGRVTNFLKIDKEFNGKPADKNSGLWFEDRGLKIPIRKIIKTPRIGVGYAGPVWSLKKFRFLIK
jgi:DNA-3-methyladenine glycosylase